MHEHQTRTRAHKRDRTHLHENTRCPRLNGIKAQLGRPALAVHDLRVLSEREGAADVVVVLGAHHEEESHVPLPPPDGRVGRPLYRAINRWQEKCYAEDNR
jgi:hypothetical protein